MSATRPSRDLLLSLSNATGTTIIRRRQRGTATGSGTRYCAGLDGACTESGGRRGTATSRRRAATRTAISESINADSGSQPHADELRASRRHVSVAEVEDYQIPPWTTEYKTARVERLARWLDPSDPSSAHDIASAVREIAKIEGPVHIDLVRQRLRDAWGIGGSVTIRDNIDLAVHLAMNVNRTEDFIDVAGRPVDRVRTPSEFVRKAEQVHEDEIGLAITTLLRDAGNTTTGATHGCGTDIRLGESRRRHYTRVTEVIDDLVANGKIEDSDGRLSFSSEES